VRAFAIERHGTVEGLRQRELPAPEPTVDQVLVRVHAAALNPADAKVLSGRDGGRFLHASSFPLVLGFDFSGVVEWVGSSVGGHSVGDEVFGFLPYSRKNRQGSFAEYVAVHGDSVSAKPEGVSHIEAACSATVASTALQALRDKGRLRAGQWVLVNGASGGVGLYALQIAKHMGATVWGTCSAAKIDLVADLGADEIVDYIATPLNELHENPRARFDLVLDAAATSSLGACRGVLKRGGTYVTLLPSLRFLTGLVRGLMTGRSSRLVVVASRRDDLEELAKGMAEGWLRHTIDTVYPFDEVPEAMRQLVSGDVVGKIAIDVAGESQD